MLSIFLFLTLMTDAARVIEIRIRMMARGRSSPEELTLIVTETVGAIEEAAAIILRGGSSALVINHYQKIVATNVARLSSRIDNHGNPSLDNAAVRAVESSSIGNGLGAIGLLRNPSGNPARTYPLADLG